MSKKFKNNVGANTRPLIGGKEYKAPPEPINLAAKFIRENPKGSIADDESPAMTLGGDPVEAPAAPAVSAKPETPAAPAVAVEQPKPSPSESSGEPHGAADPAQQPTTPAALADTPAPAVPADGTGASGDVPPVAQPVAAVEQPKPAAPAAQPARDSFDPTEVIPLIKGEADWTRDDVVRGLQERATFQSERDTARGERDQILKALGAPDVKSAMGFVEPFVRAIKENPARAHLLDSVAAMDPATLNYVSQLLEDWKQLPAEQRAAFGPVGNVGPQGQPQTPTDPRYDQLFKAQQMLEDSLESQRAEREVTTILGEWPFLRNDRKAWEAIQSAATALYSEDEAKGVPRLQRRGYMEAIAQNRVFLEHMKSAQERRVMQHATAAAQPTPQLGAPPPAAAILPAQRPDAPATARPPRKEYRGPLDGAAAAFLADQGYTK